jgi:demethylmenaquinone methyltransferase/2-methoxy-6-polyprenyl-1,4-benzoquinol methylase
LISANFAENYEYNFSLNGKNGKNMEWLEEKKRQAQINNRPKSADETYFGYERISTENKTDRVLQHFSSVARHYDFMNTLLSFGIHYAWKRTAVRMLKLAPGDRILDVCGGTGDLAIMAARAIGPAGRVVIYDINRDMIQAGMHKVIDSEIEDRLGYIQGNAESISFPDCHFDTAMVGFGIRNVTHMKKGFEEMYRILKPGGKMMCLEFSKPTWPVFRWLYDFYSFYIMPFLGQLIAGNRKAYMHLPESIRMFPMPDELSELLRKIGFSQVTYRSLTNGIAVIHLAVK